MLNGNAGLSSVRTNLKCPKETPEGIRVTYGSSRPEILSDNGVILAKELPEEGEAVSFLVTLRYGDFEKSYREELRILAAEEPVLGVSEQIQDLTIVPNSDFEKLAELRTLSFNISIIFKYMSYRNFFIK